MLCKLVSKVPEECSLSFILKGFFENTVPKKFSPLFHLQACIQNTRSSWQLQAVVFLYKLKRNKYFFSSLEWRNHSQYVTTCKKFKIFGRRRSSKASSERSHPLQNSRNQDSSFSWSFKVWGSSADPSKILQPSFPSQVRNTLYYGWLQLISSNLS